MIEHILSEKDTLERLSAHYGVPVCMILRANGFTDLSCLEGLTSIHIPDRHYCMEQNENRANLMVHAPFVIYEIAEGDTIFDIAQRHRTTMNIIARLNHIIDPSRLIAGQKIRILKLPPDCERYSVREKENLADISRRFCVPEKCIRAYNCLQETDSVYPGMQLLIPRLKKVK
jgi:hypothetical protein